MLDCLLPFDWQPEKTKIRKSALGQVSFVNGDQDGPTIKVTTKQADKPT